MADYLIPPTVNKPPSNFGDGKQYSYSRTVLPAVFLNDDTNFPISWGGSFVLVHFRSRFFAITAKHCSNKTSRNPVLISNSGSNVYQVPTLCTYRAESLFGAEDDDDSNDIFAAEIDYLKLDKSVRSSVGFLELELYKTLPRPNESLFLIGYPSDRAQIKFNDDGCFKKFRGELNVIQIYYRSPISALTHKANIVDDLWLQSISSMDGFSGGAVFTVPDSGLSKLIGIALRSTIESGIVNFLDIYQVIKFLNLIIDNNLHPKNSGFINPAIQ